METPYPNIPALNSPLAMYMAPGDSSYWYVVQQTGQIIKFANNANESSVTTFIEINDGRLISGGERGLLGMAFLPNFAMNGYVCLSYTNYTSEHISRIFRFNLNAASQALDPDFEQIILSVTQTANNHNGGQISFGPDGYL